MRKFLHTACPQFPQSSTGAEIDDVMRSGGWGPQKATVCRPSASTGTKVLLLERGACAEPGAHTYLMSKRSLDIPHRAAVTCGCRCSHAFFEQGGGSVVWR